MKKPQHLNKGDTICIVAPASPPLSRALYERGKERLVSLGYRVVESRNVHRRELLFAGDAIARANDLNRAFRDTSVKAIICAQGGCGSAHIIPFVNFDAISANPKIFIGYSDITALQLAVLERSRLITFQGPMVAPDIGKNAPAGTIDHLIHILTETDGPILLRNPPGRKVVTINPGIAEGNLVGGCLSIVVATLGTEYEIDGKGKILFFEDIEEKPHRIDRYLTQLIQSKKIVDARGLVFGVFKNCEYRQSENYHNFGVTVPDIIRERIGPLGIPAIYGLQFGHVPYKLTMPVGAKAVLNATEGLLRVEPSVI